MPCVSRFEGRSARPGRKENPWASTSARKSFRDDFTYQATAPEHIRRFPSRSTRTTTCTRSTSSRMWPGAKGSVLENLIDVDEHYVSEMHDRALVLAEDPLRCQSLPHMTLAGWDLLELLMTEQADGYPEHFSLTRDGDQLALDQPPARHRPDTSSSAT